MCTLDFSIHRVVVFVWVVLYKKLDAITETGHCICGVVVFNGSLYSRVYGIPFRLICALFTYTQFNC